MGVNIPSCCIKYPIFLWDKSLTGEQPWREVEQDEDFTPAHDEPCLDEVAMRAVTDADIAIILATADYARDHPGCRKLLSQKFQIPEIWWTQYSRRSNGHLGCETQMNDDGHLTGMTSWVKFQVKVVDAKGAYSWYKINMFVNWDGSSGKTTVFIFDAPKDFREKIPIIVLQMLTPQTLMDPFWVYPCVLENIVATQDNAVWHGIRDMIRKKEKERDAAVARDATGKPRADFAELHDIARHAIHGVESLSVTLKTAKSMITQHEAFRETFDADPFSQKLAFRAAYHRVHERLHFFEHMIDSLSHRALSNKQRLDNEIQLVFNSVAQYDASLSLQISHATRSDSAAMRTIAFLTLTFLPATFIAAIFSMSFFSSQDGKWSASKEVWIYWVIAIPLTASTIVVWRLWQKREAKRVSEELVQETANTYKRQYTFASQSTAVKG